MQHIRDLEDRLNNSTAMIECLNKKLKEKSQDGDDSNINELLQRVREQMMAEFVKYKRDTEDSVNKVSFCASQYIGFDTGRLVSPPYNTICSWAEIITVGMRSLRWQSTDECTEVRVYYWVYGCMGWIKLLGTADVFTIGLLRVNDV